MAELRIRIELQRAREGVEMSKLSAIAEEAQKFLRYVAEDIGLENTEGVWVAKDFYNQASASMPSTNSGKLIRSRRGATFKP